MTIKKEMYRFSLENRSDGNKKRFNALGEKLVDVYYDKYGHLDHNKTNEVIREALLERHEGSKPHMGHNVELENGDVIKWEPSDVIHY